MVTRVLNLDIGFLIYDLTQKDKGSGRPSLVKNDLLKMLMPIPKLDIQKNIVISYEDIKKKLLEVENQYHNKIKNLEELKKFILQKAFNGQLT